MASERVPDCGISTMIVDLLSVDASSWDAAMIGLRALLCVLVTAPARKAGNPHDQPEVQPFSRKIAQYHFKYVTGCHTREERERVPRDSIAVIWQLHSL